MTVQPMAVTAVTGVTGVAEPLTDFELPAQREAVAPPEWRGLPRDGVRLLVARPDGARHRRVADLPGELSAGDLLVVNTSATVPAALDARRGSGGACVVHVGTELDGGGWVVEVRRPDAGGPASDVTPGEWLQLPGHLTLAVVASYPRAGIEGSRLWLTSPSDAVGLLDYLTRHGRPVTYAYLRGSFPLTAYQTIFSDSPGSAEMPSAARPLTPELVVGLAVRGVAVAPVLLHCGLSSAEAGEPPAPERFAVPAATARLVNSTIAAGGRVVAAGTTVVRALESAAARDGTVRPAAGWTDVVVDRHRPARVVRGLLTGWHAPRASHLAMLEAVAGAGLVRDTYDEALAAGYLWHEFGDSCLLLP